MQRQALLYIACAEIGTGFLSILALLVPPRNIILPFLVFNFLRMRFWSPDSSTFHRQVGWHVSPEWGHLSFHNGTIIT